MENGIKLLLISSNIGKISEIKAYLPQWIEVVGLHDIGFTEEIAEDGLTFEANAELKATHIKTDLVDGCFSDDSGLCVDALMGAPGVRSARYAGEPKNDAKNKALLLASLKGNSNRSAQFRTVIALRIFNTTHFFEGRVNGTISEEERGENGFGYDSVFIPSGEKRTFAEMTMQEKSAYSHRSKALYKMVQWLESSKSELIRLKSGMI